jgi:hypothetical protein
MVPAPLAWLQPLIGRRTRSATPKPSAHCRNDKLLKKGVARGLARGWENIPISTYNHRPLTFLFFR